MINLLVVWLITSISLFILSKLPLGTDIDKFGTAIISAAVFGILNAILGFFLFPINFLTFGLLTLLINAAAFGIATLIVKGFRLRWGFWSALIGAIWLTVFNSLVTSLLPGLPT
ncbi:phage holin family protein [Synechococcales cyanobacterium C]|uniref:Phage holin family protein n=1 Tax=Petrachloros mirabilis ULC683 TaxID=2781853 RepID=A0A8K2A8N5_9CYAN|nr:phage holin family protein [Petrachloros mirabilis]NCJ08241.1 phage holin family protein [Petrachloros mirabilis ULC683]